MSITPRVRTLQRQGFASYQFEILNHFRDKAKMMKPNHKVVERFGTIRDYRIGSPSTQLEFWKRVDAGLDKLIKRGKISEGDRAKIEKKFLEFISRPAAGVIVPPKPKLTFEGLRGKYPMLSKLSLKSR